MKIVVTAAVSQIGYWVLRRVGEAEHQVFAGFHRRQFAAPVAQEIWTGIDLQHPAPGLTDGPMAGADVLIHCGPPQFAPNAARLGAALKCRAVVAFGSTSAIYHDLPRPFGDPVRAAMLRRLEQEFLQACANHRIAGTLFRPTMVYGAGMDGNVARLARMIARSPLLPLPRQADGLRQPIHADDIAALALTAASDPSFGGNGQCRVFDIAGGEQLPYRAMVRRIGEAIGRPPRLITVPGFEQVMHAASLIRPSLYPTVSALYRMRLDQVADNEPAERAFGFAPRAFTPSADALLAPIHLLAG
ncbi:NAD-dependent epimerase/dehydratase family protein [Pacificispira sp.]|uniref:NAD-dependent epimerase/dehydratase family protein n=1 Tax=Pacificispira sp. TaxID=2888761 RepID=UPI003B518A9D